MAFFVSIFTLLGKLFGLIPSTEEKLGKEEVRNADLKSDLQEKTNEANAFKEPPRTMGDIASDYDKLRDKGF